MRAYEECLSATSSQHAPWYVVPADDKDNARLIVSQIVLDAPRSKDGIPQDHRQTWAGIEIHPQAAFVNETPMPTGHRQIPSLPERPHVHPIAGQIYRSYPVGRQSFSRAFQGEILALTITTNRPLPDNVQASLMTTLNSKGAENGRKFPSSGPIGGRWCAALKPNGRPPFLSG